MIGLQHIELAQKRLMGIIKETPCLQIEKNIFLKLENLQVTGSFKIRGAFNAVSQLTPAQRKRGIIAASAGNHSQGVALSARKLKIKATIVMPTTTPIIKIENTKKLGATVILYGETFDESFSHAKSLAKKRKLTLIHAFDDEHVIAGQGTVGLEILKQVPNVDVILVPVGGGGLISGIAKAVKSLSPKTQVIGVQAKGAPAAYEAFRGKPRKTVHPKTIADGIAIKRPGRVTLTYMKKHVDKMVLVSEEEIVGALVRLLENHKLISEPAGIVSLSAAYSGKLDLKGKRVVCVLSGGNIDIRTLSAVIRHGMVEEGRLYEFTTLLQDKPGALEKLSALITSLDTNILSIQHERLNPHSSIHDVEVDVILETANANHIKKIKRALKKGGYEIED